MLVNGDDTKILYTHLVEPAKPQDSWLQETKKISNKQPNLHLKQLEKEEQKNPKVSRRKEIIKIRSEINEMKEQYQRSIKLKAGLLRR